MADQNKSKQQEQRKQEAASTQAYLNISEIKDGVVVLKDGSLRAVLMTSAVNFALKSSEEQDAMIYAYQRFLNSLNFPIQILIHSRRLDLDYYLDKLKKRADDQQIELVKLQTIEYGEFISRLISVTNIMDKRFYVVVPYFPPATEPAKGLGKLFATNSQPAKEQAQHEATFQNYRSQLLQRTEAVASGLGALGVRAAQLNSEELVELFYSIYNPQTATKQRLVNVDELTAPTVQGPSHGQMPTGPAGQTPQSNPAPMEPETESAAYADMPPSMPEPPTQEGGSNG
ncbi:MAG: hypothetical protein M3N59_02125 [bacterium]|nr:hypothetical protein [bacterium]